ncbi:hypothetical protein EDB85DRAFT_2227525 [Lactarius pseudohatsudake]|nr:hypothetical protein EDB85DRAFT_2227525 [Lactarius pseudohatsudake]
MRCLQLSVLSVLAAFPFANFAMPLPPPWDDIRVKHTIPPYWEALGRPPTSTTIDLRLAQASRRERIERRILQDMVHISKEQVAQPVAPHSDTLDLIDSWLGHHAVPSSSISTTHGSSWLRLTGILVSQANELLGASYQVYRRIGTNDSSILRTIGYAGR